MKQVQHIWNLATFLSSIWVAAKILFALLGQITFKDDVVNVSVAPLVIIILDAFAKFYGTYKDRFG